MQLDDPELRGIAGLPDKPKKVSNPFYEATELDAKGQRKEAERIYLDLLNTDFENPVVMAALGMNYAVAEKNGLAHLLLTNALERMPDMVPSFKRVGIIPKSDKPGDLDSFLAVKRSEILNAIGTCYKHENHTQKARECFEEAQLGVPLNPDIQNNLGTLYINEGKPTQALEHLAKALTIDPEHAQATWNSALAWLELGDYAKGWKAYHAGLNAQVRMDRNYTREPLPFWDGAKDKTLVVYGEQGIGDEILFASVLPDVLRDSKTVVFECHKKLHKLFANSFPTLDIYPTREDMHLTWPVTTANQPRYPFDAKMPIGDLPRFYRNSLADFPGTPYLTPTPDVELHWNEKLATLPRKPNIGISWIGGHKRTRMEVRSIALERLLPILSQDANFISLQYTPCEEEIAAFKEKHGITLHHWPEAVYSPDYNDTAGLVANLDLVISVATSVIHLGGGLGVPTWVLTASRAAWREYYCPDNGMPWYNSVRIFKQAQDSTDWQPVIDEVAANLQDLLGAIHHG